MSTSRSTTTREPSSRRRIANGRRSTRSVPVDNGAECLSGLDYRTAAWRGDEEDPFHTEVGYWLWDGNAGQVMRCFTVPRGSTLIGGDAATPNTTTFTMRAEVGSETYGILSNQHLAVAARTILHEVTVTVQPDTFSSDETTTVEIARTGTTVAHTDRNILRRVG